MRSAHRLTLLLTAVAALLAVGCGPTVTSNAGRASCNGELDGREDSIDSPFDVDGDGFFDAANPECQVAYAPEDLDCNDTNADVNPEMLEETCNDIDDDCDEETLDVIDADEDGWSLCDGDCADSNPEIGPGLAEATCDGLDNDCDPTTFDAQDIDMDGYDNCEDCVDTNAAINPGETEQICDGADNDCDPLTIDGEDVDMDGSTDCFDCDDFDPNRFPGNPEICDDGIDQNCDNVDADCPEATWAGNWVTPTTSYTCGGGNVVVNFNTVTIQDQTPNMTFVFVGSLHPGALTGTIDGSNNFTASASYPGTCSKQFDLVGGFLGANNFSATLTGTFTGCSGCTNQTWNITGTR
ncbi:MAG: putative metal-binding motif-containing protein [Deltaproteobacteria bacterium]|nr:putative metal-binding motif-containing protein [Deltaproteobacteria bacterium]